MWDVALREFVKPADALTFDGMHCLFSNGLVDNELTQIIPKLVGAGFGFDKMSLVVQADWRTPRAHKGTGRYFREAFNESRRKRLREGGRFTLDASTALRLVPVFAYMLATMAIPFLRVLGIDLAREIQSFRALQALIGCFKEAKNGGNQEALEAAIKQHLQAFKQAYPDAAVKPKNHWMWHLVVQLIRDRWTLDCFVGERYNHFLKRVMQEADNTSSFEVTVLRRMLIEHFSKASHSDAFATAMQKPQRCEPLELTEQAGRFVVEAFIGLSGKYRGLLLGEGDMVTLDEEVHEVHPDRPSRGGRAATSRLGRPARPSMLGQGDAPGARSWPS